MTASPPLNRRSISSCRPRSRRCRASQTKEPPLQSIFYQNKFWDAKSLLIKFIRRAKKELIVIDAYPGVATGECCQCENVASGQFQFPMEDAA